MANKKKLHFYLEVIRLHFLEHLRCKIISNVINFSNIFFKEVTVIPTAIRK